MFMERHRRVSWGYGWLNWVVRVQAAPATGAEGRGVTLTPTFSHQGDLCKTQQNSDNALDSQSDKLDFPVDSRLRGNDGQGRVTSALDCGSILE